MKIQELLDGVKHQDLVLPEFQREYVWKKEDAKQLLVSLYKKYPTGSLLFWKTDNPPELKNMDIPEDKIGTTTVILDGQQRLTTLFMLMRNEIPPYYKEEEIFYDPRELYFNLKNTDFKYFQPSMKDSPLWIKVSRCFDNENPIHPIKIAQEVIESKGLDFDPMKLATELQDNLFKLKQIESETYPIQTVPVSANIDEAIDIFDRVNSQGTKLTDSELALAHICGKWSQARQVMKEKINQLQEKNYYLDLVFMTRALTAIVKGRASLETIHKSRDIELKEGWKTVSKILDYLTNILPANAHIDSTRDISSTNILIPVMVYLSKNRRYKFNSQKDMNLFIHWIYAAHMWGRYSSQTDQRLEKDISIVLNNENPHDKLIDEIIEMRGRIEVKPGDIAGKSIRNPFFNMAYITSKARGALDWQDGTPIGKTIGDPFSIHKHHIFPSSLLYQPKGPYSGSNKEDKLKVNEIANRALLTRSSNFEISNRPPSDYLEHITSKYPGELEKQFITTEKHLWTIDRYGDFLKKRQVLIAEGINQLMESLLQDEPPKEETLEDLIIGGESETLEFKSTLSWDVEEGKPSKKMERIIAKTISGFMNTRGGIILIGVADDGSIYGIEDDLKTLFKGNIDGFQLKVKDIIQRYLGLDLGKYVHMKFEEKDNKTVCILQVEKSHKEVYLKLKGEYIFYIRVGASTDSLTPPEASDYIKAHFN